MSISSSHPIANPTNQLNQAFIDGQNLFLGTANSPRPWRVDLARFRIYLQKKYNIDEAYYFLGYSDNSHRKIYDQIKKAGFILVFREHQSSTKSQKKGNVDTDIVFAAMRSFIEYKNLNKIFLVSGDGDYYRMVKYLCEKCKFGKILHPSRKNASSLYRQINAKYRDYLDSEDIRRKIGPTQKRGIRLGS